jgi:aspartokinase
MSYGEFFALHTVYHYLQEKQFDVKCIDSTSLIVSDDNFGEAKPLLPETTKLIKEKLVPFAKRQKIILTQGFVAKNKSGEITTMGIESSNLTAVLLAEILNINQITFWTDVSGVMTADPKYIKKTKSIEKLSYQQAYDYARNGLKLIYPEMLNHAASKKIKLIYRSASNPEGSFTEIYDTNKVNDLPIITFFDDVRFMDYKFSSKLPDIVLDGFVSGTIKSKSNILAFNNNQSGFNLIFTPDTDYEAELKRKFPNSNVVNCSYLVVSWKDLLMNLKIIFNLIESEKSNILFYNYTGQNLRIVMKNVGIVDVTAKIHSKIMSSLNKGKNKE